MRRRIHFVLIFVFFIGVTSFCARKAPEFNEDDVLALLDNISQSPMEFEVKAERPDISIEPGKEKDRYRIIIINPTIIFSTAVYKHLNMEFPEIDVPLEMGEIVMTYDPLEKNLRLESAKKIKCTLMLSKLMSHLKPQGNDREQEVSDATVKYYLENVYLEGYDISSLIDSEKKSFEDVLTELVSSDKKMNVEAEGFKADVSYQEGKVKTMEFLLKNIESSFRAESELVAAFFQKQDSVDILTGLLEKKEPLIDLGVRFKGMDLAITTSKQKVKVGLKSAGFSYSLKPSPEDDYFDFMSEWNMGSLDVEGIPEKIQFFTQLNKAGFKFSVDHISSEFINAYFDITKTTQSAGAAKDLDAQQELMMKGPVLANKFVESKPNIKVFLSPLDHYFGKIQVQGEFQFVRMGPPVGKAEAKIFNMNKVEQNIKQALSPEKSQAVINWIKRMFHINESGQARMTFELKEDDPSHFYLNEKKYSFKK